MTKPVNPSMITLSRELRGLTQRELADRIGITQGALSRLELGLLPAKKEVLYKMENALGFPATFFTQEGSLYEPTLYYRRRYKTSKKILSMANAEMNLLRLCIQKFLKSIELDSPAIPYFDVERDGSPEKIANKLREFWRIPKGPIKELVALIESKGIIIFYANFESDNISGSGMFTTDRVPIIYVNKSIAMCRKRFTICHELFHVLAHANSSVEEDRDVEKEADRFASEFLMPSNDIRPQLVGRMTISKLADLKRYWKTSMQSILMVANKLKAISERHNRTLWIEISKLGFKKNEPRELEPHNEAPKLFSLFIDTLKNELGYSDEEISSQLHLSPEHAREIFYNADQPRLKISVDNRHLKLHK